MAQGIDGQGTHEIDGRMMPGVRCACCSSWFYGATKQAALEAQRAHKFSLIPGGIAPEPRAMHVVVPPAKSGVEQEPAPVAAEVAPEPEPAPKARRRKA